MVGPKGQDQPGIDIVDPGPAKVLHHIPHAYVLKRTTDANRLVGFFDDGTFGFYDLARDARVGTAVKTDIDWFDFVVSGTRVLVWPFNGSFSELDLDAGTVKPFGDSQAHIFQAMAAGPDRLITSFPDGGLVLRDSQTGVALAHADGGIYAGVAGTHIATAGSPDGVSWVMDPDSLQPVGANIPSRNGGAESGGLSADERRLVLLAEDHTIRLLDVPSRTQLGDDIDVHVTDGAGIRPDGLEMSAASDHGIVVWDLDPSHWISAACAVAGRNLTHEEWDHYLGALGSYRATCPDP